MEKKILLGFGNGVNRWKGRVGVLIQGKERTMWELIYYYN